MSHRETPMRVQARITLPPEVREPIDLWRQKWNPERAVGNPAHLTLAYHDEAPDFERIAARMNQVGTMVGPFPLILGECHRFPLPIRGIYLSVTDPTAGVTRLREILLAEPFTRRARYGLHVTLLHPDQGERLESAWEQRPQHSGGASFTVDAIQLVGPAHEILLSVALRGATEAVS